MENIMTTSTFCIEKCVANFTSSVGNGATMTKHYVAAVNYVIESRDTTPITRMYQAAKRRGDNKTASLILSTFGKVFVGAEATRKKNQLVGIKIAKTVLSNEAVSLLHGLAEDKVSMRGPKFTKAFKKDSDGDDEFDLIAFVVRTLKNHPDTSKSAFSAAFSAA
jgi:hypothetical protein